MRISFYRNREALLSGDGVSRGVLVLLLFSSRHYTLNFCSAVNCARSRDYVYIPLIEMKGNIYLDYIMFKVQMVGSVRGVKYGVYFFGMFAFSGFHLYCTYDHYSLPV